MVDILADNARALIAGWQQERLSLENWRQAWELIEQMAPLDYERANRAADVWADHFDRWQALWGEQEQAA